MGEPRLLVFGDIHGSISTLHRVLARLRPTVADTLLFLGDYIDRGEDSRAVLDLLMELEQQFECIFLKGNHEELFLSAYAGTEEDWGLWLTNGGLKTLLDFESDLPPDRYVDWIRRLQTSYETDAHYFVHAGVQPGKPPAQSCDFDRLWIREPFLSSDYDWGKTIVFGHTVQFGGPLVHPNKVGIDTGAFMQGLGRLTCLVLPEGRLVFSHGRSRTLHQTR
jgi:diadenosine tetraphosphatase ApaH/serine/threonine PP2A family protein phosphatase